MRTKTSILNALASFAIWATGTSATRNRRIAPVMVMA